MLGAVIGDMVGSVYEWNNRKTKDFTPFFHARSHPTDDSVLTIAVADSLLNNRPPVSPTPARLASSALHTSVLEGRYRTTPYLCGHTTRPA